MHVRGLDDRLASELRRGLALATSGRRLSRSQVTFYPSVLEEDIGRAKLFLAKRGYPYAAIVPFFEPDSNNQKVAVILDISSGPAVINRNITTHGLPYHLKDAALEAIQTKLGSVFNENTLQNSVTAVENLLKNAGYARATVAAEVTVRDSTGADLLFRIQSGAITYFGGVVVDGIETDLASLARKTIAVRRGARYDPVQLQRARNNLRLLDLFRQIRLDIRDSSPDTLDVVADLIPRDPRTVEAGIGYWTDELFRARARWIHRNLFRSGRGLSIGTAASRFLQNGDVSLWWPALLGARTRAAFTVEVERQDEESYELLSTGAELSLVYYLSYFTTARIGVSVGSVDVEVTTEQTEMFLEKGGLLTVFSFRLYRNASNDQISPTRGTVASLNLEWAPNGFLTDNHFILSEVSGTVYVPLRRNMTIASNLSVGIASPTDGSKDLLPNKRFYSGGASSMRGFQRRKLGPVDAGGAPLGGEAKLEWSEEIRFPIVGILHGALFMDAGQVWSRLERIAFGDVEVAVGTGLRVHTPVGPVRGDIAYRLTDYQTTERRWAFHLSVGHPF